MNSEIIRAKLIDVDDVLLEKFVKYNTNNSHVFRDFSNKADLAWNSGRVKYSAWTIINSIRWDYDISTTGDTFKISNDYIALFARLYLLENPQRRGFFQLKQMKRVKSF